MSLDDSMDMVCITGCYRNGSCVYQLSIVLCEVAVLGITVHATVSHQYLPLCWLFLMINLKVYDFTSWWGVPECTISIVFFLWGVKAKLQSQLPYVVQGKHLYRVIVHFTVKSRINLLLLNIYIILTISNSCMFSWNACV